MTRPVFVAPGPHGATVVLDGPEGHHAAVVRRLRVGEEVEVVDGHGLRSVGTVTAVARATVTVHLTCSVAEPAPRPRLTVVQAVPKGDRGELAVEVLTEVGVDVVVPWQAERCVARWSGERGDKGLARWRATAREAAKQARRSWHAEVTDLASTAEVAARLGSAGLGVVLHEEGTQALPELLTDEALGDVVLVVGPEGGIGADELDVLTSSGARVATLGPTVLRTSTAGVVAAGVVLAAARW